MKKTFLTLLLFGCALVGAALTVQATDLWLEDDYLQTDSVWVPGGGTLGGVTNLVAANYSLRAGRLGALKIPSPIEAPYTVFELTGYETAWDSTNKLSVGSAQLVIADLAPADPTLGVVGTANASITFNLATSTNEQAVFISVPTTNFLGNRFETLLDLRGTGGDAFYIGHLKRAQWQQANP